MFDFSIKIAGVPVAVRCRYPATYDYLLPYRTTEAGVFAIAPTDADLERMREEQERTDAAEGIPLRRYSRQFLERSAIHALLAERLVGHDVLLMHGSALCMDGQAYIFTGKSGTGKSTHAKLWREAFGDRVWMINDDKPMLRITEEGIVVWGTPWDGKHHLSRNAGAPLKAILQIRQADENRIEPLAKADAFPLLMSQAYRPGDPAAALRVLALEKRILETAAFYTMYCNQKPEAALTAYEGVRDRAGEEPQPPSVL